MTAFSAILSGQIDADSPIDTVVAGQWSNNLLAVIEGDASAAAYRIQSGAYASGSVNAAAIGTGVVGQPELGANSVGQSEVKTSYQQISLSGGTTFSVTATGGAYVLGSYFNLQSAGYAEIIRRRESSGAGYTWTISKSATASSYIRLYYVNSSPPHNYGNGDIPYFVYGIVDNNGDIVGYSAGDEPPHIYNGPTNIMPSRYAKDGRVYGKKLYLGDIPYTYEEAKSIADAGDPGMLCEYLQAYRLAELNNEWYEYEITFDIKNADMNILPHPFTENDWTDKHVVLLDPMSPVMEELLCSHNHDQGNVGDIINKYLKIGNESIIRKGPQGLMIVDAAWKPAAAA